MQKHFRRDFTKHLCYAAAMSAVLSTPFTASATPYECNLSGGTGNNLSGCVGIPTGGYLTSTTAVRGNGTCTGSGSNPYCAVSSDNNASVAPILAWNVCRWVDNPNSQDVFVPFKSAYEWTQFLSAAPSVLNGLTITNCAVPYSVNGAPAMMSVMPPFAGCTQISASTPNVYGRTSLSRYPEPAATGPNFTCHAGSTTMMSLIQWTAGNYDVTPPGTLSWNNNFKYSPDVILSIDDPVISSSGATTISWYVSPYIASNPVTCSVSPWGWGPNWAGFPRSGTAYIAPNSSTTYTLTCREGTPSLTSVASANITVTQCCSGGSGSG